LAAYTILFGIMAYPFFRYMSDGAASLLLVPLAAAIVIIIIRSPKAQVRIIRFSVIIAACAIPLFIALFTAEQSAIKYLAFCLFYVLIAIVAIDFSFAKLERLVFWYTGLFCLSLIAFVIFPSLPQYEDSEYVAYGVQQIDGERLRGIFPHANDLGIFAAALALFNLWRTSFTVRSIWSIDILLIAICALITIYSGSVSGLIVLLGGVLWRFFGDFVVLNALRIGFVVISVLQLLFYGWAQDVLISGSFWWRFHMAERVWEITPIVHLRPDLIASQETWSHSLILDLLLTYGIFLTIVAVLAILIYTFFCGSRTAVGMLIVILPMCVQPPGALPASFMILVFAVASCIVTSPGQSAPSIVRKNAPLPTDRHLRLE
jgi:hypothetical protein